MFFSHLTTEHRAESHRAQSRGQQCPQRSPQPPRGVRTLPFPPPHLHQPPAASGENRHHDIKGAERMGCKCILFVCGKQEWGTEKIYFRHYEMF